MRKKVLLLLYLLPLLHVYGGEGMWLLNNLSEQTKQLMKELGLEIPVSQIYSTDQPCLENAIVSFGGFCSGVVVSEDGLIFTNHHCGFDAIQQHSTVEHDYLKDGFVAHTHKEELPNPDLYVSFLVHTEDVTQRILSAVTDGMKEQERRGKIPAGLPEGAMCANKTGELEDAEHDAAIVSTDKGDYAICVMSSGLNDTAAARGEIVEISGLVYQSMIN